MFEQELVTLRLFLAAVTRAGGDALPLRVSQPAEEQAIVEVEGVLGFRFPEAFRHLLSRFAASFDFQWFVAEEASLPDPFGANFSGVLWWDLEQVAEIDAQREIWATTLFPDPADRCGLIWRDKLAFARVGNGDLLALDLNESNYGRVIYLSHDDGPGNGVVMAEDMIQLVRQWAPLGCPGAEDWQWMHFLSGPGSGIDPLCQNALRWRELWLGDGTRPSGG